MDVPGVRRYLETRLVSQVPDYWTKLLVAARSAEQFYTWFVIQRPVVSKWISTRTPKDEITASHQLLERINTTNSVAQRFRNVQTRMRIIEKYLISLLLREVRDCPADASHPDDSESLAFQRSAAEKLCI